MLFIISPRERVVASKSKIEDSQKKEKKEGDGDCGESGGYSLYIVYFFSFGVGGSERRPAGERT